MCGGSVIGPRWYKTVCCSDTVAEQPDQPWHHITHRFLIKLGVIPMKDFREVFNLSGRNKGIDMFTGVTEQSMCDVL